MSSIRPTALIVEDQPLVGLVTSDVLGECGFETVHAFDANEASNILERHPEISLLVSKHELPGHTTGLDLCRRVSRERPQIRLIVTSSSDSVRMNNVPERTSILRMPFASSELRAMVEHTPLRELA